MSQKQKWLSFMSIAFGLFTAVMDASMIGIALPSISKDFSLDLSSAAWISLVSTITVVAVLLPMGNISDRVGRKKIYLYGIAYTSEEKDLVISEAKEILDVEDVVASILLVEDLRIQRE